MSVKPRPGSASDQGCENTTSHLTISARHEPSDGLKFILSTLGSTTVVSIHSDTRIVAARWLAANSLPEVTAWAKERNVAGHNLYFAVNTPVSGLAKKPTRAEITMIRAGAFGDFDAKAGRSLAEALAAIVALPMPAPSFIIATGGGFQPIWLLDEALPPSTENQARAEAICRRIAQLGGGDMVQNVDRILRLPFTTNYPNAKKRDAGRSVSCSGLVRDEAGR